MKKRFKTCFYKHQKYKYISPDLKYDDLKKIRDKQERNLKMIVNTDQVWDLHGM